MMSIESSSSPVPARPSSVYGPVVSWRFGRSLGIDPIVETSTCSFNCVYCQLGSIQRVTMERRVYVPTEAVAADLAGVDWAGMDVVTFSGSGEPTLATNLGEIVALLRRVADKPLHMLTNATLFGLADVRRDACRLDVVACKLDAIDDATLARVNRPAPGIDLAGIVAGIERFRAEFRGKLLLQVMLMPSTVGQIERWAPLVARVRPDEIQLNTPRRPYPAQWYLQSRGDHEAKLGDCKKTPLRTITREEARQAEEALRRLTGIPVVSVYRDEPAS
jgi:wyosine [tRNA(Phe)-imidazoG37] synthetase (radical SAM superfamily)